MSDIGIQTPKNPHKVLRLNAGTGDTLEGDSWVEVLSRRLPPGSNSEDYFAPGIEELLGIDGNTTFTLSTSADMEPAFKALMEKLQGFPGAKFAAGAQRTAGFIGGLAGGGDQEGPSTAQGFIESLGMPPNVRYQTELTLMPSWKGTSEVTLESLTFKFNMGMTGAWDARTEVYNPVIGLAAVNLPRRNDDDSSALLGPLPTQEFLMGRVVEALTRVSLTNENEPFSVEQAASNVMQAAENAAWAEFYGGGPWDGLWSVTLGRMKLPDFYVTNTSHSFSVETDEQGFPIAGTVTWGEIKSVKMATRGLPLYRLYGPQNDPTEPDTGVPE